VAIILTNVSPFATTVNLVDDAADGDSDDTVRNISLGRGQSYVRYLKDGAVNDDAGGKWDGDYFLVDSQDPVVVQMSTKSDWQWDFVPAENKTMRGQSFFIYSPSTTSSQRDINLVAYEDDTEVYVLDITATPLNATGLTTVNLTSPVEVLKTTLNAGEDLIGRNNLGIDILDPGRSYWIRASKGVTCQYGSLVTNGRDGGGFVPSENGFASGELFYFFIPRDAADEREVRIVSFSDDNVVQFSGWNKSTRTWVPIGNYALNRFGHADWVESGTDYPMYRLTCTPGKKISVFAASWLEAKGLSGTKDIASFASSESGFGAGKEFLVYVPQPGVQGNVRFNGQGIGNNGHLFIYGHVPGTTFTVVDADTQGRLFSRSGTVGKGGFANIRMNATEFAALNKPAQGLRPYLKVTANHLVTVMVTNFNDNWMTFTPSVVLPNPIVRVTSDSDTANVGSQTCLTVLATNEGAGALTNGLLEVPLDSAVTYVSADWSIAGMGAPQITTVPETGGQLLTWEGYTIPAGGRLEGTICFTVNPRRANNSIVKNRDFLSFPVLMRGLGTGVPVEQGGEFETFTGFSSVVLTVNDTAQTNVSGLAATPAGNSINVTWLTGREPDLSGFRVYRSTSGDGPFARLTPTPIPGTGDALTGASYLFLTKPLDFERVRIMVRNAVERHRIIAELDDYKNQYERTRFRGLMGSSPAMQRLYRQIRSLGMGAAPVLLVGERGTELSAAARAIHDDSPRSPKPFLSIKAAGATAGALNVALREASGGTLYIEEVELLGAETAAGLKSFLSTGSVEGERHDTRVLAGASPVLAEAVAAGRFDAQLQLMLEVGRLEMPRLKDRGEDVLDLAEHLLGALSKEVGRSFTGFDDEAQVALVNYSWPGNRDELDAALRAAVQRHEGRVITREMLPKAIAATADSGGGAAAAPMRGLAAAASIRPLWQVEKEEIEKALKVCEGNVLQAARLLEISPGTIYRKQQTWKAMKS